MIVSMGGTMWIMVRVFGCDSLSIENHFRFYANE